MALITDYCSLAELKSYLRITDTADDTELSLAITNASRAVDQATNRRFGQEDPATARYYTASKPTAPAAVDPLRGRWNVETEDISTTTSLVVKTDLDDDGTFETTLTINTDFRLWPWNASAEALPWQRVVLNSAGSFPTLPRNIEVTAKWGFTSVPSTIKNATLMQAARFFKRRDSPFGVAGSPDMGNELRLLAKVDPDVAVSLTAYRRLWAVA